MVYEGKKIKLSWNAFSLKLFSFLSKENGNLSLFNKALLGKWSWRFVKKRDPLWKWVIIGKYGVQEGAWCTKELRGRFGVRVWKAIRNGWDVFKANARLKVDSRIRMKFWGDRWCRETPLRDAFPSLYSIAISKDAWAEDVWDEGSWSPRFIRHFND